MFVRCDFLNNLGYALHVNAPELVVVEASNIRDNGGGILFETDSIHPDSRVNGSNLFANGTSGLQLETHHLNGRLDISGNYWAQTSDPELSASWRNKHNYHRDCTQTIYYACQGRYPLRPGGGYENYCEIGAYTCRRQQYSFYERCTADVFERREGPLTFTGFSPVMLQAGPDLSQLPDAVIQARTEQGL